MAFNLGRPYDPYVQRRCGFVNNDDATISSNKKNIRNDKRCLRKLWCGILPNIMCMLIIVSSHINMESTEEFLCLKDKQKKYMCYHKHSIWILWFQSERWWITWSSLRKVWYLHLKNWKKLFYQKSTWNRCYFHKIFEKEIEAHYNHGKRTWKCRFLLF